MSTNVRRKQIDAGRVTGLNSYELAVKLGKFSGTYEEYLHKEMQTFLDMKKYADAAMTEISKQIASVTEGSTNMAEVVSARGAYDTLDERLDAKDEEMDIILDRLNSITDDMLVSGEIIKGSFLDEHGNLYLEVMDVTSDHLDKMNGSRIIEMRNNGSSIQWRYKGFTVWNDLLSIRDIIPKLRIGSVETVDSGDQAAVSIDGAPSNPVLNISVPRGPAGLNGGEILDATLDDDGNLWLTVSASEFVNPDGNAYPILKLGTITTVDSEEEANATLTGTITNPVLNLWLPRGKSPKIVKGRLGDDGWIYFEYE